MCGAGLVHDYSDVVLVIGVRKPVASGFTAEGFSIKP